MINFNKNKLINTTLEKYYETFEHTLDTIDYVPEKYNDKICKYIFKNMKKAFKKIDKEDFKFQKELKKKTKEKIKLKQKTQKQQKKKGKFIEFIKNLFKRCRFNRANPNKSS